MAEDDMDIGWRILFNEDAPKITDPNIPANIPRKKAEDVRHLEGIKRFMSGEGKELAGQWKIAIQSGLLSLLQSGEIACHCPACIQLTRCKILYNLFLQTGKSLEEKPKDG